MINEIHGFITKFVVRCLVTVLTMLILLLILHRLSIRSPFMMPEEVRVHRLVISRWILRR
jgi:hypothetical protein